MQKWMLPRVNFVNFVWDVKTVGLVLSGGFFSFVA